MASTSSVSMVMPLVQASEKRHQSPDVFLKPLPLPLRPSKASGVLAKSTGKFEVNASLKEKAVAGLTAAALTASMVVPDVAEAASSVSPSLKNFLLSIGAGGAVLTAIVGAVVGVSNFDPVKRG
ncbi:hypothetical protein CASFOL_042892 [Castilleja foliolosa]|uniref:Ultraviolet-B-repressible protein n=1 Tax=Castilleja foliolosa TaxID=1961234 RepID=A0ABD3B7P2_9LAMI